jgi:hypothetical protein
MSEIFKRIIRRDRRPRGIAVLQGSPRSPTAGLPLHDPARFRGLPVAHRNGSGAPSHSTDFLTRAIVPHSPTVNISHIHNDIAAANY